MTEAKKAKAWFYYTGDQKNTWQPVLQISIRPRRAKEDSTPVSPLNQLQVNIDKLPTIAELVEKYPPPQYPPRSI